MTQRNMIAADDLFAEWRKDPDYVAAYDALEGEFRLAAAIIAARKRAGLTQSELAKRMGMTQSNVARIEGGRTKPSTTTLEKIAAATGTRLTIGFLPRD